MPRDVVVPKWFLKPINIVILEFATKTHGRFQVPSPVGVDHKLCSGSNNSSNGFHPLDVATRIRTTYLDFDAAESVSLDNAVVIILQYLERPIKPSPIRVVRLDPLITVTSHQFPKGQPGRLGPEVPKGNVHRAKGQMCDSTPPNPLRGGKVVQLSPKLIALRNFFAHQKWCIGLSDATRDQAIGGKMGVSSSVATS